MNSNKKFREQILRPNTVVKTARNYVFTYWKMPELIDDYMKKLSQLEYFRYSVAQLELSSKTKKLHIQGYIEFTKMFSMRKIKKLLPGIHLEKRKGTREEARDYCMKDEKMIERKEYQKWKNHGVRLKGTKPIEVGVYKLDCGKRTDIDRVRQSIKDGKKLKDVIMNECVNYQGIRIAEKLYQYNSTPRDPANPPEIRWYYGETGTGKTKSVYDEFKTENIYSSFSYRWFDGYAQEKVLLIDDFRRDYCKYHMLLKLLDRYPHQVQIKGGTIHINSPIIIITSPYHPKRTYQMYHIEDIEQLLRRITVIKKFGEEFNVLSDSDEEEEDIVIL